MLLPFFVCLSVETANDFTSLWSIYRSGPVNSWLSAVAVKKFFIYNFAMQENLSSDILSVLLQAQKNEITEHFIYMKLADSAKEEENRKILQKIARDELDHYNFWKAKTGKDVKPSRLKILFYTLLSRIFGITFTIKLMEKGEEMAQESYTRVAEAVPEAKKFVEEEDEHEHQLIKLIDEERLKYAGSFVLGLNDALVELTGALAGLTLALRRTDLIALAGLVTGIAAAMSMAASEYLSTKTEDSGQSPGKAALYTGIAYIFTVALLIFPYFVFANPFIALGVTLSVAILIIMVFTYYISVAKDLNFKTRFLEMAGISLGVAAFSFLIGHILQSIIGVEL